MKKDVFNMPKATTIMARSSSITNSLINGIIPAIEPTEIEIKHALASLEQDENDVRCVYCGDKKTEWDHLHPLIINKKHSGYITEIANLVPACGKCNQSKGNSEWKEWMTSSAEKSPASRNIPNLEKRIKIIENYDKSFTKRKINIEEMVGKELWDKYLNAYNSVISSMKNAQEIMNEIKEIINGPTPKIIKKPANKTISKSLDSKNESAFLEKCWPYLGKKIFIKYFEYFVNPDVKNADIEELLNNNEPFSKKSCKTRAFTGKKIVSLGLTVEALQKIIQSSKIDETTKLKAKHLLEVTLEQRSK